MSQYIPKKLSELSAAELAGMARGVGLPGLPYPMARLKVEEDKAEWVMGAIESATDPLVVYSPHLDIEQVNRELYCNMPTPSMMSMARDLIEATKPATKNRLMAIFGDPSSGKTFLFRQVGALVHPQGVVMVDCGGMNVRELFWRTVIDYGSGVREQLDARAASGSLNPQSIAALKVEFPDAVVEKDGRVAIVWSEIGKKRDDKETSEAAMERAQKLLNHIYSVYEGISTQSNAFGIKSVPGELLKSFQSGRPILLDEFTKCKVGSDDSMQTFLEFVRGDRSEWTTINPMPTTAAEDEKTITLRSEDIRLGWHVGISGNEAKDGDTTHNISDSLKSRLNPRYITEMTQADWEHRIPQLLAGFPVKTFYDLLSAPAESHPEKFSELMNGLSTIGLSPEQVKLRPAHHSYFLQNFPDLIEATKRLASVYTLRQALSNTESKLFSDDKWSKCADEIMAGGAQKLQVTSRRFLDDLDAALRLRPHVVAQSDVRLDFDLHRIFNEFNPQIVSASNAGWHQMGAALSEVILEGIVNDTAGMPLVRQALIAECKTSGIVPMNLKEATPSNNANTLADLLKFDTLKGKGLGDSEQAKMVASALYQVVKGMYPQVTLTPEEFSLENVAAAVHDVERSMEDSPHGVALLNADLDTLLGKPMVMGYSIPSYKIDEIADIAGDNTQPVPLNVVLSSLTIPGQLQKNLDRLWMHGLSVDQFEDEEDERYILMSILKGTSKIGVDIALIRVADKNGQPCDAYMMRDRVLGKALIISDDDINSTLKTSLKQAGVSYYLWNDKPTFEAVDKFILEGDNERNNTENVRNTKLEHMMKALMALYGIEKFDIEKNMTFGKMLKAAKGDAAVYSHVVMPRMR